MSFLTTTYDQSDAIVYERTEESDLPYVTRRMKRPYKQSIYYSDVNSSFRRDDQPLIVIDSHAINRQMNNVLSTPLGSDWFEPTFGSLLPYRLFDPITPMMAFLLRNDTIDALSKWMSSKILVDTVNSKVNPYNDDADYEGYLIDMRYQILKTGVIATYSMAFLR